jgi:hypothetical protein
MSEGVLLAIWTSVSIYVERPICIDVMCFGNHAAYDAHKKHKLARVTKTSYRTIVPFRI